MFGIIKKVGSDAYRIAEIHSPEICFGLAVVGTIAGTVFACKATIKSKKVIDEAKEDLKTVDETEKEGKFIDNDNNEVEYTHDKAVTDKMIIVTQTCLKVAKYYAPAVGLIGTGLALFAKDHQILCGRITKLAVAYEGVNEALKKSQAALKDVLGEEGFQNLKFGLEEKEVDIETGKTNKDGTPKTKKEKRLMLGENPIDKFSPYCRIYDSGCRNWEKDPAYNLAFLKGRQCWWNDVLRTRSNHTVFLNEIYRDLGFEVTKAGNIVGWSLKPKDKDRPNPDGYIDFGIFDMAYKPNVDFVNGIEPVCLLDFNVDGPCLNCIDGGDRDE